MIHIGRINILEVIGEKEFGYFLDGDNYGEILLPKSDMSERYNIGEEIKVFIYFDSEDRIIATTKTPKIMVGEFNFLEVVSITNFGAFLNWGLNKDLFIPFSEQTQKMEEGKVYLVYAYYDEKSKRIAASSRIEKFTGICNEDLEENQLVDLIICKETDLGFKAIINNKCWGIIYKNEVFQELEYGQQIKGYIKKIRHDGKIDLCIDKPGPQKIDSVSQNILNKLIENDGFLPVTDKTSPEVISSIFGISKKTYKKAIGALYKRRHIKLEKNGIRLLSS